MIYPPGRVYIRGEERAQPSIAQSTATAMRAPNDLAYGAALLKKHNYIPLVRDYQTRGLDLNDLLTDITNFQPEVLFVSVTTATILEDLEVIGKVKSVLPKLTVALKGALFFDPEKEFLERLDLQDIDYLIGNESEFSLLPLLEAHFGSRDFSQVLGVLYRDQTRQWQKTEFHRWAEDLDSLVFPDRSAIENSLYVRPDTQEPMATIVTSRGCPSSCTFCLTPLISGKTVRFRSPANVLLELENCVNDFGIRNFFFRSDTFTIDPNWTRELCERIIASPLHGKIQWAANSRSKPLKRETLKIMKHAGCWLVAFGFESGHPESLRKIRKGTTVEDNLQAARWAREAGLQTLGFYMIGFPWERPEHWQATHQHTLELDADFIELHIAFPYHGTELFKQFEEHGFQLNQQLGQDYFNPSVHPEFPELTKQLVEFRRRVLLQYHLRPRYLRRRLLESCRHPKILKNYVKYGWKLINQNLISKNNLSHT